MLEQLGDIGFVVFVVSSMMFTLTFLTMSKAWYKSFMGVVIAIYLISTDVMCIYFGLRIWDVTLPGVDWIRFLLFWLMAVTMIGAVVGLIRVQFSKSGEGLRRRLARKYNSAPANDQ